MQTPAGLPEYGLSVNESTINVRMGFLNWAQTVAHIANRGLRGTFRSAYTNLRVGYRPSNNYFPRYWLYAMLSAVLFLISFSY